MIRFVDLGKQLGLDEGCPRQFAFYNTVVDAFVTTDLGCVWSSWKEFEDEINGDPAWTTEGPHFLRRVRGLCQSWVYGIEGREEISSGKKEKGDRLMKNYIVRYSQEYSTVIEAESEEDAIQKADQLEIDDWDDLGSSDIEAEAEE